MGVIQVRTRHGLRSHANAKNIVDIVNNYSSSVMDQFKPPGTLSFDSNVAENYCRWLQMFEIYAVATGLTSKGQKVQCAAFLHVAGEEAIKVFNTFTFASSNLL